MSGLISSVSGLLHRMTYCHLPLTCCGLFRMGQSFVYVLLFGVGGRDTWWRFPSIRALVNTVDFLK